jgi:glycine betaine/choline ABC-type transport system substrate-binding protein
MNHQGHEGSLGLCRPAVFLFLLLLFLLLLLPVVGCEKRADRIVVGSKNFTENLILGEMFAQMIEGRTHLLVERRFYLAGTFICQQAIVGGRIDIYPEYTGTALTAVLKQQPSGDKQEVYRQVRENYESKFGLIVGPALGFDDSFAMVIRGDDARRLRLETLSEAARFTPQWRAGFGYEFMERPDGYKGLVASYGLRFAEPPRIMDLGLITRALKDHQVDIIAGNNTDGLIPALDLFVLRDDHHYFPPYEAVAVMREEMLKQHPEVGAALDALGGAISDEDMRRLNFSVDGQHRDAAAVVKEFLKQRRLIN